ncbi:transcription elongation factor GreA [Aurantimonas aggregata]|uniref:Transcription elongation factor GreA n=1 Tax=Aurantimonas aggregata TaxID=2047720 RepID=A0A6L9ME93_9HYPH|nr:transcription elongation factor GreA [Aurantimonas aggregata]NDV85918.1 transcription elongation factor GreA [Aurantimonas aggregata]
MSVAFVKEPNDSQVEVLPDRELGEHQNIVTARGLELIDKEISVLEASLEEARQADDKIAAATINRDLRYWRARHATAEVAAPDHDADIVQFGSRVTIERPDGRRQSFRIVGIDEGDPAEGLLSYVAPLARSLIGKQVGDVVKAGADDAEIVEMSHEA